MLPVSDDSLLFIDEPHTSVAYRVVKLVFDSIFGARFVVRLPPEIGHVVGSPELERNEMIDDIATPWTDVSAARGSTAARNAIGRVNGVTYPVRHVRAACA